MPGLQATIMGVFIENDKVCPGGEDKIQTVYGWREDRHIFDNFDQLH